MTSSFSGHEKADSGVWESVDQMMSEQEASLTRE